MLMTSSGVEVPAVWGTSSVAGAEQFGAGIGVTFHVMHAGAVAGAGLHQLARVVSLPAADHDHDVDLAGRPDRR